MKTCKRCQKQFIKSTRNCVNFCSDSCQTRLWQINHPERWKATRERWRLKHSKDIKLRFSILMRDNFTCQYCGRKAPDVVLHADHVIPVSKGGKTTEANLRTACADCNIGKSDRLLNNEQT